MVADASGPDIPFSDASKARFVTLLDTNALVWLAQGHQRTRRLARRNPTLAVSPASLLELQFLVEAGRVRLRGGGLEAISQDDRWAIDEPPAAAWFQRAWALTWTRDPFDRLIVAHARFRGWRLATADTSLLGRLDASEVWPL
jgi:PIN domain nuclease of toxin-antitoxin system